MRFSLKNLLIGMTVFAAIVGYSVTWGIAEAVVFTVLAALTFIYLWRALGRWNRSGPLLRLYAVGSVVAIAGALVVFVVYTATDTSLARQRTARHLQFALWRDDRLDNVRVEYKQMKRSFVVVEGVVQSEDDFATLRSRVHAYDWREMDGVVWEVQVIESGRRYDGWDSELFGDEDA